MPGCSRVLSRRTHRWQPRTTPPRRRRRWAERFGCASGTVYQIASRAPPRRAVRPAPRSRTGAPSEPRLPSCRVDQTPSVAPASSDARIRFVGKTRRVEPSQRSQARRPMMLSQVIPNSLGPSFSSGYSASSNPTSRSDRLPIARWSSAAPRRLRQPRARIRPPT